MSHSEAQRDLQDLDEAIGGRAESAFAFLEHLISAPSTVGKEHDAQEIVEDELRSLGFAVKRLPVPDAIGRDPAAGVPQASYRGRFDVLGRLGSSKGPSLLLNAHVDVVPASEPELWTSPPFQPARNDGWLRGRGAGDMKGGLAMATLAIGALLDVAPGAIRGRLLFLSAIEEECTGNGTLAAVRRGVLADAVVLPEPTDLDILLAGVGIMWLEVTVHGRAAHAQSAHRTVNPIEAALALIDALRDLERQMNERVRERPMSGVRHPYNVNLGTIEGGDWPSSVPPVVRLGVRIGYPTAWGPARAEARVRRAIERAANRDPWLRRNPPQLRCTGLRAEGYALPARHPLAKAMAAAHRSAHGSAPAMVAMGSTTDARFYVNQFAVPALCYGPRTRNIHGVDEAVELQSVVQGARTLARFLASWYREGAPR